MKPLQKGYSLVEVVMVLVLLSLSVNGVKIGRAKLQQTALEAKVSEVVSGIEYMKHGAVTTGTEYIICCFENHILFKSVSHKSAYEINLGKTLSVDKESLSKQKIHMQTADKYLFKFSGTMAPASAATLILKDGDLKKKVRITVGVATGKIRVYYETL